MKHSQTLRLRPKNRNKLYSFTQLYCSYRWFLLFYVLDMLQSCFLLDKTTAYLNKI